MLFHRVLICSELLSVRMDAEAITQLVTVLAVGLAIIWNQQRSIDKLRDDVNSSIRELRIDHDKAIAQIGERLARIEGFLGIGIPPVADESAGDNPK